MHQGGKLLDNELTCDVYTSMDTKLASLNVSASKGRNGAIYVSICNIDPTALAGLKRTVEGAAVHIQ